jgi:mannose-6-phosphate isomerase-like protein (cupin superfamily)
MKINWLVLITACAFPGAALAQQSAAPQSATPRATIIGSAEIKADVERTRTGALADSMLRVVPIESKYNIGVAVVRRSPIDGHTQTDALVHEDVTEVYQIIEGNGVLVTGGTLESAKPVSDDQLLHKLGPTSSGERILGGTLTHVGPGDIVIIPPHMVHGFVEIGSERIVYTIIRIDPKRLLVLNGNTN